MSQRNEMQRPTAKHNDAERTIACYRCLHVTDRPGTGLLCTGPPLRIKVTLTTLRGRVVAILWLLRRPRILKIRGAWARVGRNINTARCALTGNSGIDRFRAVLPSAVCKDFQGLITNKQIRRGIPTCLKGLRSGIASNSVIDGRLREHGSAEATSRTSAKDGRHRPKDRR